MFKKVAIDPMNPQIVTFNIEMLIYNTQSLCVLVLKFVTQNYVNFIPCVCKHGSLFLRLFYPDRLQEDHIEFQRSELAHFSYCC